MSIARLSGDLWPDPGPLPQESRAGLARGPSGKVRPARVPLLFGPSRAPSATSGASVTRKKRWYQTGRRDQSEMCAGRKKASMISPTSQGASRLAGAIARACSTFIEACANAFRTEERMFAELERLPLKTLRDSVRDSGGRVEWSESLQRAVEKVEVSSTLTLNLGDLGWHLQVSDQLHDFLDITDENTARGLITALAARPGVAVDCDDLLNLLIPPDASVREQYEATFERYGGTDHQAAIEAQVDGIDALVGPALGLDAVDLASIREDMLTDPFLKNIVPRWPGSTTRLHGYRTGLDSAERYA